MTIDVISTRALERGRREGRAQGHRDAVHALSELMHAATLLEATRVYWVDALAARLGRAEPDESEPNHNTENKT